MRGRKSFLGICKLVTSSLLAIGLASSAFAGSIQQPGLTTGLAEGYAPTEGLYSITFLNSGVRQTDPDSTVMTTAIPTFLNWSTPWEVAGGRLMFKAAPLVYVDIRMNGSFNPSSTYSPYLGAWLSWYLGNGLNLALGSGAQIGLNSQVNEATGRDFTAFQQNVALSYVKDNWNITGNSFYTTGRTSASGSQPETANLDFTAIKRDGRMEYGLVGYGQWDLNNPSVGYGGRQSEVAIGGLFGYLIGNQITAQVKLTTGVHERNLDGHDTRLWFQLIIPLYTPAAPNPSKAYGPTGL